MNGEEGKDTQMEDKNPVLVSKVFLGFQQPNPGEKKKKKKEKEKEKTPTSFLEMED